MITITTGMKHLDGSTFQLGRNNVLVGDYGSGKTALASSVQLAFTGTVTDELASAAIRDKRISYLTPDGDLAIDVELNGKLIITVRGSAGKKPAIKRQKYPAYQNATAELRDAMSTKGKILEYIGMRCAADITTRLLDLKATLKDLKKELPPAIPEMGQDMSDGIKTEYANIRQLIKTGATVEVMSRVDKLMKLVRQHGPYREWVRVENRRAEILDRMSEIQHKIGEAVEELEASLRDNDTLNERLALASTMTDLPLRFDVDSGLFYQYDGKVKQYGFSGTERAFLLAGLAMAFTVQPYILTIPDISWTKAGLKKFQERVARDDGKRIVIVQVAGIKPPVKTGWNIVEL